MTVPATVRFLLRSFRVGEKPGTKPRRRPITAENGPGFMKDLFLLRHCKSSWDDPDRPDHDRPLTLRGRESARIMRAYLHDSKLLPDIILCSTATRTVETMTLMFEDWPPPPVQKDPDLYLTGRHALLSRIARVDDRFDRAMVIGHNPDLQSLAASLAREGDDTAIKAMRDKFPTGALAHIEIGIDHWIDLPTAIGRLQAFVTPKQLRQKAC